MRTAGETGALTVAGQWRSFTAFPSILAIAVVGFAVLCSARQLWHESDFHPINFYTTRSEAESGYFSMLIRPIDRRRPFRRLDR